MKKWHAVEVPELRQISERASVVDNSCRNLRRLHASCMHDYGAIFSAAAAISRSAEHQTCLRLDNGTYSRRCAVPSSLLRPRLGLMRLAMHPLSSQWTSTSGLQTHAKTRWSTLRCWPMRTNDRRLRARRCRECERGRKSQRCDFQCLEEENSISAFGACAKSGGDSVKEK